MLAGKIFEGSFRTVENIDRTRLTVLGFRAEAQHVNQVPITDQEGCDERKDRRSIRSGSDFGRNICFCHVDESFTS
ncbi:hypothetical protein DY000_02034539 [Brassica cretica]|uniref:Uncharacterized protein n=1 Tax=Brassica cretica TaxID=69181 RepID=A0ABQ7DPT4_BRACR|nr:hypothetical protein DY000_02034539 [Brassica cretica]